MGTSVRGRQTLVAMAQVLKSPPAGGDGPLQEDADESTAGGPHALYHYDLTAVALPYMVDSIGTIIVLSRSLPSVVVRLVSWYP